MLCPRLGSFRPCLPPGDNSRPLRSPHQTHASVPSLVSWAARVYSLAADTKLLPCGMETEAPWRGRATLGRQHLCTRHPGSGLCPQYVPELWHHGEEFTRSLSRQLGSRAVLKQNIRIVASLVVKAQSLMLVKCQAMVLPREVTKNNGAAPGLLRGTCTPTPSSRLENCLRSRVPRAGRGIRQVSFQTYDESYFRNQDFLNLLGHTTLEDGGVVSTQPDDFS